MYCKKCGKFLAGNENYCSNCGEKVVHQSEKVKTGGNTEENKKDGINGDNSSAGEIVWDMKGFQPDRTEKDKEIEFNWSSEGLFMHSEMRDRGVPAPEKNDRMFSGDSEKKEPDLWNSFPEKNSNAIEIPDIFRKKDKDDGDKKETAGSTVSFDGFSSESGSEKEEPSTVFSELNDDIKIRPPEIKNVVFDWGRQTDIPGFMEGDQVRRPADVTEETELKSGGFASEQNSTEDEVTEPKTPAEKAKARISRKTIRNIITRNTKSYDDDYLEEGNVVDIEQPKSGSVQLEIEQDEVTGLKVEKVIVDNPKMTSKLMDDGCDVSDIPKAEISTGKDTEPGVSGLKGAAAAAAAGAGIAAAVSALSGAAEASETSVAADTSAVSSPSEKTADSGSEHIGGVPDEAVDSYGTDEKNTEDSAECGEENRDQVKETAAAAEEPKQSLIDEILPSAVEVLRGARISEEKKQIDKFYTFNKTKEDFQKLLDKEYERFERKCSPGGFEEDIEGFMDVTKGTEVEATSQIEEMAMARNRLFDEFAYGNSEIEIEDPEDRKQTAEEGVSEENLENDNVSETEESADGGTSEGEMTENTENDAEKQQEDAAEAEETEEKEEISEVIPEDTADVDFLAMSEDGNHGAVVFEPKAEESLADTLKNREEEQEQESDEKEEPAEEKTPEVAKIIINPEEKQLSRDTESLAREFFEENDDNDRPGIGRKIAVAALWIILIIAVVAAGIRILLPESPVSKVMSEIGGDMVSKVTGLFGDDEPEKKQVREELLEDKTELIENKSASNYKNLIESVVYDSGLAYDENIEYSLKGLKDAKDIQTNIFYEDAGGTTHYYDEEIVGVIIEFESMRNAWENDGDRVLETHLLDSSPLKKEIMSGDRPSEEQKFESLAIGDIKVAGNSYYVWVKETINGDSTEKVYEIQEQDKVLYVTDSCTL